jgi:hypothetical protein
LRAVVLDRAGRIVPADVSLRRGMGQETGRAVVGEGKAVRPVVALTVDPRVGQAGDRPLGAQQLAGVLGDRVEDLAQLGAAGQLEGDRIERGPLVLLAAEIGEGGRQGRRGTDCPGEVDEIAGSAEG